MAEHSLNAMLFQKDDEVNLDVNTKNENAEDSKRCMRLDLSENIGAYLKNSVLERQEIETLTCNGSLIDKVVLNYIIVKQILGNLSWQDKLICKHVCLTWYSAIQALKKEQLCPEDFVIDFSPSSLSCKTYFRKSGNFSSEPLVVLTFVNISGYSMSSLCKNIEPVPCSQPCKKEHSLLEVVHKYTCAPKDCHFIIRSEYLSYMPLASSQTKQHTITRLKTKPFIGGLFIPAIPFVKFHTINIKTKENIRQDFFESADRITKNEIVKGVLVFVNDKFLLHSVEDIIFLNYFKDLQPDTPYALGGCIVDDTVLEQNDFNGIVESINNGNDFVSETLISIGVFTIPKGPEGEECSFDMFSLILKSSEWAKAKIQQSITEFSKKIPKYEHSAVLKLSCVGRDQKHKFEQDCFRAVFPDTPILGCYGNGELGISHPEQQTPESPTNVAKKIRRDPGPQFGIMYSYSSVFVYIGWGKKLSSPIVPSKK